VTVMTTVIAASPEPDHEPEPEEPPWLAPPSMGTTEYVALGAKAMESGARGSKGKALQVVTKAAVAERRRAM
jgi:hypothetical protein